MRKKEKLIALLRRLVNLLADESARNPDFAGKLEGLLSEVPGGKASARKSAAPNLPDRVPDIHAEWIARGEADFRLWLRDQPIPVLRDVIRAQDLDSTRRTAKWKEANKLADFISDSLRARLSRGSAFIGRGAAE